MTDDAVRRLVLLRHAKAEAGGRAGDQVRPLALTGRRQCIRIAGALTGHDLVPELVLCSSSVRTLQTWVLVRGGLGHAEIELQVSDGLYQGGAAEVVTALHGIDDAVRTVLVVGHEPTMSRLAAALASPDSGEAALATVRSGMSTGAFAVLEVAGAWHDLARGAARLTEVVSPRD